MPSRHALRVVSIVGPTAVSLLTLRLLVGGQLTWHQCGIVFELGEGFA